MKNLMNALLAGALMFPTVLSPKAIEVNAKADKVMAEIAAQANASRHDYIYYKVSPWNASVADEVRHRLNQLDGVWTDQQSGPIYVHFQGK